MEVAVGGNTGSLSSKVLGVLCGHSSRHMRYFSLTKPMFGAATILLFFVTERFWQPANRLAKAIIATAVCVNGLFN